MIDAQTATLAGTGLVLAVAAIQARLDAMGPRWITTTRGRPAHAPTRTAHTNRRVPASVLLSTAASELARAIEEGRAWDAWAWARRARHLARTVQATDKRRARYQRARAEADTVSRDELESGAAILERATAPGAATLTPGDPAPDVVTFDPELLPAVVS